MNFPSSYQGYFFPAPGIRAYKQVSACSRFRYFFKTSRADLLSACQKLNHTTVNALGIAKKGPSIDGIFFLIRRTKLLLNKSHN